MRNTYNFKNKDGKNLLFYINQDTNRYDINMLFNQMIDYCVKHNLSNRFNKYFVSKDMRARFVEFCYTNK